MKPGSPPLSSARLLDQLREVLRNGHYSPRAEQTKVGWGGRNLGVNFTLRTSSVPTFSHQDVVS